MSDDNRTSYQLIDNLGALKLMPKRKVEKHDWGIISRQLHRITPDGGYSQYGENYQGKVRWRFNKNSAEHLKNIRIGGKIAISSDSTAEKATIDGDITNSWNQLLISKTNSTKLEQIDMVNRLALSHKVCTYTKENARMKFSSWSDNLYKNDNATNGTSEYPISAGNIPSLDGNSATNVAVVDTSENEPRKRHLTKTAQPFEFYLSEISNFCNSPDTEMWHSKLHAGLDIELNFEKDKNIVNYVDNATFKLVFTDLYLILPVYTMSEEYYREILKSPIMVGGFEGVRVFSVNCANSTEQHISLPVGKNNIIGCKIMFRDSSEDNSVATSLSSDGKRYLSRSINPEISNFQIKLADTQIPLNPIQSDLEFYEYMKEFYLTHHDTDCGNLINYWNFTNLKYTDGSSDGDDQKTLSGTSMFHLAFDFSKNGIQSGLNGKQDNLLIDFTTKYQITNLQADVFVFYSCIVQHTGSETRIMS